MKIGLAAGMFLLISPNLLAQIDTIDVHSDLQMDRLPYGTSQYLVYVSGTDGKARYLGLWRREVTTTTLNRTDVLLIEQRWISTDTVRNRTVRSFCSLSDFTPIHHLTLNGNGTREAFDFSPVLVRGSDTTAGNAKTGFSLPLSGPTLNWELDLEVFSVLPYETGKSFLINFYHPGGPPPNYHRYDVMGEESLEAVGGSRIDCWVLSIDYGNGSGAKFWISKATREVLKSWDFFRGGHRYKVKLGVPM